MQVTEHYINNEPDKINMPKEIKNSISLETKLMDLQQQEKVESLTVEIFNANNEKEMEKRENRAVLNQKRREVLGYK